MYDHIGLNQRMRDRGLYEGGLVDPAGVSGVVYVVQRQVSFGCAYCLLDQALDGALRIVL